MFKTSVKTHVLLACTLLFCAHTHSADLEITNEFKANISNPAHNTFVNTTPVSGFCRDSPQHCQSGEFSIIVPGLMAKKEFDSTSADLKKHTFISLDGTTKRIVMTAVGNPAQQYMVDFRWSFFGVRHNRASGTRSISAAMSGTGSSPSGGCSGRTGVGSASRYRHGWGVPERVLSCYRRLNGTYQGTVNINEFSVGYTLNAPSPLSIPSGEYTGEVVYQISDSASGPGFIGLGADDYNGETEIRIRIKSTVQHAFFYQFPANSGQVSLAPRGGWSEWINGGRPPQLLSQEVPFILSSSSGFNVQMRCEFTAGQGCGLKNSDSGQTVPLNVLLTLPEFKSNGFEVRNLLLTNVPVGHQIDLPGKLVFNRRSLLNFRVQQPGVNTMLKAPGSRWRGSVTLILDAGMN